jgi:hypothetical protein
MDGVQFVVNDKGENTAVLLDLSIWGELWEDIYDAIVVEERQNEERIPLEEVHARLEREVHECLSDPSY